MHTYNKLDVSDVTAGANSGFWPTAEGMRPLLMAFCHANVAKLGRKKRKLSQVCKVRQARVLTSARAGTEQKQRQHSILSFFLQSRVLLFGSR